MNPVLRFILAAALLALPCASAPAQTYGLSSRPDVAAYLDGLLPAQPPAVATNWTTVVAFQNLHFDNAMGLLPLPGTTKLVVWEREGRVWSFENHENTTDAQKTLILDLSNQCQGWDDMGMLGVAFHPDFAVNGYVYVFYNWVPPGTVVGSPTQRPPNATTTRQRLARYTFNPGTGLLDPGSEYIIIDQTARNTWHNGGGMFFHPVNGFLYLTNGNDNSGSHDQVINRGMFGCVLRIDVDKRGGAISHQPVKRGFEEVGVNWPNAYYVPNDNPFVGVANAVEEIYALGLRSPHRMTIDPVTNRIFIGDVGGGSREEISVIEPSDPGGLNFQWPIREGYNGDMLAGTYFGVNKRPILDYPHGGTGGNAVIGGYVYRGTAFPELAGKYLFCDNTSQRIWMMDESTLTATTPASRVLLATIPRGPGTNSGSDYLGPSSWGHDANNELYICQLGTGTAAANDGGRIYKLQRGGPPPTTPLPATLSATGIFGSGNLADPLTPSAKLIPYALNAPFYSDGAIKTRWATVPNGTAVGFSATGDWQFPAGSVLVKHFELPADDTNPAVTRRLETRLLVKMAGGGAYGATYKWRADNSDADLMDAALTENVPIAIPPVGTLNGADLGAPAIAGSTVRNGDAVTITAGGTDIWGNADQGHFASQQRTGDFDIAVRIESLTQANLYTKAGLMARESLAANSRHVYALAFPSNAARGANSGGYEFQYRATTGGNSSAIYPAIPQPTVSFPNSWLRLQRTGNTFIASSGTNGIIWTEFARTTLALPPTLYFGLAVTAHTASPATTAKFWLQSNRYQAWYYPSRTDCISCHNPQTDGVLGPSTRQLNKSLLYPAAAPGNGVADNQIRAWNHVGLFHNPPTEAAIPGYETLAPLDDLNASLEKRARSYLDANCSYCHRPGAVQAFWDGRYDTPLTQQGIVYGAVGTDLGISGGKVVVPQDLDRSLLYHRVNKVGANQMPPLGRNQIDTAALPALAAWINALTPAPPPAVALTAPSPEATYVRVAQVPLSATASDPTGISKVEFRAGGALLGTVTAPPYSFVWNNPPLGDFNVTATAFGSYGNSAQSTAATIHVQNPPVTFQARVNFEIAATATPVGWLKDTGATYAARGNGYTYGWSRDNTADARQRNAGNSPDVRYDTLMHLQKTSAGSTTSFWEIAVPNGYYDVRIVAGDPGFTDGVMHLTAEGVTVINGSPTANWIDGTASVTVADGKLTIAPGASAVNSKICFAEITRITIPPSVALTGLPANPAFVHTDTVTLTASAADSDGNVVRVEFWDGNMKLGEDFAAPYSWTWTGPLSAGFHNLRTVAYDNEGRVTTSATISVNVLPLALNLANPTWQPGSPPVLSLQLQTTLPAGRAYVIEWSDDFTDWQPVQSGNATAAPLDISTGTSDPLRFYRLRLP